MPVQYLDCRHEVCEIRSPPSNSLVWLADEITDSDWRIELPQPALDEIARLARWHKNGMDK